MNPEREAELRAHWFSKGQASPLTPSQRRDVEVAVRLDVKAA